MTVSSPTPLFDSSGAKEAVLTGIEGGTLVAVDGFVVFVVLRIALTVSTVGFFGTGGFVFTGGGSRDWRPLFSTFVSSVVGVDEEDVNASKTSSSGG